MFVHVKKNLPKDIENSVFYPKQRDSLKRELFSFMKEQISLREDLMFLRNKVGDPIKEEEIRSYMERLSTKYNDIDNNVGLSYHIEATRIDYGLSVHVIIFRGQIHVKKFVFRFRKTETKAGLDNVSSSGIIENYDVLKKSKKIRFGDR
jgi:hypothetical protein